MGYASAVSVILFVIVLIIALVQRQLLRRFDV
jgi:multiple sugar transport system permease protein